MSQVVAAGYETRLAHTTIEALQAVGDRWPDLIVVTCGIGAKALTETISSVRARFGQPIIVMSPRQESAVIVAILDAGADDHIMKPVGTAEILARLRARLRRVDALRFVARNTELIAGDLRLSYEERTVWIRGQAVLLSPRELDVLWLLTLYAGQVLSSRFIMTQVWGPADHSEAQILAVYIRALRRKLEPLVSAAPLIVTIIGRGYRLDPPSVAPAMSTDAL